MVRLKWMIRQTLYIYMFFTKTKIKTKKKKKKPKTRLKNGGNQKRLICMLCAYACGVKENSMTLSLCNHFPFVIMSTPFALFNFPQLNVHRDISLFNKTWTLSLNEVSTGSTMTCSILINEAHEI